MISGSASGVADCSVLVGCDAVPNVSKGRVASFFKVKQCCLTALNVYVTHCFVAGDVALCCVTANVLQGTVYEN